MTSKKKNPLKQHASGSLSPKPLSYWDLEKIHWLWPGYIPKGKLMLVVGDPGLGKSFILMDLSARMSQGFDWPDGQKSNGWKHKILYISAEDAPGDTIRPRIESAGGDSDWIHYTTEWEAPITKEIAFLNLTKHLKALEEIIKKEKYSVVIIDPLTAYLGDRDSYKDAEMRGLLGPISKLAERTGCTIIGIMHLNKSQDQKALQRVGGSVAFAAAARAVFAVAETSGIRVFGPIKMNIEQFPPCLKFTIPKVELGKVPKIDWEGVYHVDMRELIQQGVQKYEEGTKTREAEEFLMGYLTENGPQPVLIVKSVAANQGIALRTLELARKSLGELIITRSTGSGEGKFFTWEVAPII